MILLSPIQIAAVFMLGVNVGVLVIGLLELRDLRRERKAAGFRTPKVNGMVAMSPEAIDRIRRGMKTRAWRTQK